MGELQCWIGPVAQEELVPDEGAALSLSCYGHRALVPLRMESYWPDDESEWQCRSLFLDGQDADGWDAPLLTLEVFEHEPMQAHAGRRSLGRVELPLPPLALDRDASMRLVAPLGVEVELRWLPNV